MDGTCCTPTLQARPFKPYHQEQYPLSKHRAKDLWGIDCQTLWPFAIVRPLQSNAVTKKSTGSEETLLAVSRRLRGSKKTAFLVFQSLQEAKRTSLKISLTSTQQAVKCAPLLQKLTNKTIRSEAGQRSKAVPNEFFKN
ncbi:MAG: hypothetical protein ACRYGK_06055 [Janthinobacterium lividum]